MNLCLVDHVQYDSEDSGEEVDSRNYDDYMKKQEEKLWARGVSLYVNRRGRYVCPFHVTKPRDGTRDSLMQHVRQIARTSHSPRDRADHAALLKILEA